MKQINFEKIDESHKFQFINTNKKEGPVFKFKNDNNHRNLEESLKNLENVNVDYIVDKRVARFKKMLNYSYDGYRDYLLKKMHGDDSKESPRKESPPKSYSPNKKKSKPTLFLH